MDFNRLNKGVLRYFFCMILGVGLTSVHAVGYAESTESEAGSAEPKKSAEVVLTGAPDKIIEDATNMLIKELLIGSKLDKSEQSDHYRKSVDNIVAPFIDFKLIAKRVMAKHYKLATDAQKGRFETVFRDSLLDIYTRGISNYSDEEIKMLPFDGIKVSKKSKKERASVQMEIRTKEGEVFPITYQLYKNPEKKWQLENMILNGVNLGLTYRNQFNEAIKAQKGNIDNVIDEWTSSAAIEEAT